MSKRYAEITWKDAIATIIAIIAFIGIIIGVSLLVRNNYLIVMVMAAALLGLVYWHTITFAYRCGKCDHEFEISTLRNLVSPHGPGRRGFWKLLKCPECRRWSAARLIRIKRAQN